MLHVLNTFVYHTHCLYHSIGTFLQQRGGGGVTGSILDVDDLEGALVVLLVDNRADTAIVGTASDHAQVSDAELDEVLDLTGLDVQHDGIVLLRRIHTTVQQILQS